jgi:hypothetical protein
MLTLIPLLLAAAAAPPTIGDVFYGHAGGHADGVDFTLRPPKLPACRGDVEIQKALAEKAQGQPQSCLTPIGAKPLKVDAAQPKD